MKNRPIFLCNIFIRELICNCSGSTYLADFSQWATGKSVALLHWRLLTKRCLQYKAHFISACKEEAEIFGFHDRKFRL